MMFMEMGDTVKYIMTQYLSSTPRPKQLTRRPCHRLQPKRHVQDYAVQLRP